MNGFQKAFDRVVEGARKQKERSVSTNSAFGICMYRSLDGCKCFFGMLIPDEYYDPKMECSVVARILDPLAFPDLFAYMQKEYGIPDPGLNLGEFRRHQKFYMNIQSVHDGHVVENWEQELESFAKEYGLSYEAPKPEQESSL